VRFTQRLRAAAIHLAISVAVAVAAVGAMLWVWYPPPFFEAMGAEGLVFILVAVDVCLGPLITLIVATPGKPRRLLLLDLTVIGLLQLAALGYGVHVVAKVRPAYVAFVIDRFEVATADSILDAELARVKRPEFKTVPRFGPMVVAARMPTDPDEQMRITISATAGADLKTFPQHFVAYEEELDKVRQKAMPLAKLRERHPEAVELLAKEVAATGVPEAQLKWLPLRARKRDMAVLVDANSGRIAGYASIDPW
jgi:cytochrome c oxidase assembly factor CtaG